MSYAITYGTYNFPGTFQEKDRVSEITLLNKKTPFILGSFNPSNATPKERTIEIVGDVGSFIYGSGGNQIITQADLAAEYDLLSGLQRQGRQPLSVLAGRYYNAFMSKITHSFIENSGFRAATWTIEFTADDPLSYSTANSGYSLSNMTDATWYNVQHLGNARAYPVISISVPTGTGNYYGAPKITYEVVDQASGNGTISLEFSFLSILPGGTLTIQCNPRPEYAQAALQYNDGTGGPLKNAWQFVSPATDFTNTLDYSMFLPYIEPASIVPYPHQKLQVFAVDGHSGTPTITAYWPDTWL